MAKKKKKSTFISFFISVAVLYAFYYIFIEQSSKTADKYVGKQSIEMQAFVLDVTMRLKEEESVSSANTALIDRAEDNWLNDPFYDMMSFGELALSETHIKSGSITERTSFTYSGFLNVNNKKIAIINDMEYMEGETLILASGMFVLEDIFPTNVIIMNKVKRDRRVIQLRKMEE